MKLFSLLNKTVKRDKSIDEMSIFEIITTVPHCKTMSPSPKDLDGTEELIWLNPYNQECFNSGRWTVQDFRDWANGTGRIVKGDTQEEKDHVMFYAQMRDTLDYRIFIYHKYFNLLEGHEMAEREGGWSMSRRIKNPIKGKNLAELYYNLALDVKSDLRTFDYDPLAQDDYTKKSFTRTMEGLRKEVWGNLRTLYFLGHGYYGASNTPQSLDNLAWASDLIIAYGYYLFLEECDVKLPEFELVRSLRYKS